MNPQEKLRLIQTVMENTEEGIMITNRNMRILYVNTAFAKVTGYEDAVGKTPRILQSGIQDESFYTNMWDSIYETGNWQGEIWNKRKNGEVYPEWLNITQIKNEEGKVTHYVGVFTDMFSQKHAKSPFLHMAYYDALTGVSSRVLFEKKMIGALHHAQKQNHIFAVMFLDLDRLKAMNDTYGHQFGDRVLQEVASRLQKVVTSENTVCRWGGDEFTILLEHARELKEIQAYADRLLQAVSQPFWVDEKEVVITSSIGISVFPKDGETLDELLSNADTAMYLAKEKQNMYHYYHSNMAKANLMQLEFEKQLRKALDNEELVVFYQPQIHLHNGQLAGLEALVRWRHPKRGLVHPDQFIPLAEETGLIEPMGDWVLETACRQMMHWHQEGYPLVRMAVNVSARQFQSGHFLDKVASILRETGLPPDFLDLELTERVFMKDAEQTLKKLEKLAAMGVQLSIDDFGTAYSSFLYLKDFPLHRIKIDRCFIQDVLKSKKYEAIVTGMNTMLQGMGMEVIAEGVETLEQLILLKGINCDVAQGYYFEKAIPVDEVEQKWLA